MRRIFFGMGTLVLGLATLMWTTAPVRGGKGGHGGGGGHASGGGHTSGGGHAVAHTGSVHYGARVTPAQAAPAVRTGTVRSEHYAGASSGGAYRNPYRDDYFRHFRPGYSPYILGGAQYYGYNDLPLGYQEVVLGGITYYLFDGVYYQPYIFGGQTVYLVTPDQ